METHRVRPWGFATFLEENQGYALRVLEEIRLRGSLTADDLPEPEGELRRIEGAWCGTVRRAVVEAHFGRGLLAVTGRRPNFSRAYDLAERVLSPEHYVRQVEKAEAQRKLLQIAAQGHGVGTVADLADYFRMPVRVEGWREPAYLHPEARIPQRIIACTLFSPFDPVVWFRPRTKRLFHFDYRIEILVPKPQRKWGYCVLPFLWGGRLVARVDLKADRAGRRLLVLAAHAESGVKCHLDTPALAGELRNLADWLGLDSVVVNRRGHFARALIEVIRN